MEQYDDWELWTWGHIMHSRYVLLYANAQEVNIRQASHKRHPLQYTLHSMVWNLALEGRKFQFVKRKSIEI